METASPHTPGYADVLAELVEDLGRVAASSQPLDRRHARVVPPPNLAALHQLQELALGEQLCRAWGDRSSISNTWPAWQN